MIRFFSEEKERQLISLGERLGREKRRAEGREEGIILAKRETFIQILEFKFGKLSDVISEMINQVDDVGELDHWVNRALSAETLGDLWDKPTDEDELDSA